MFTVKLAYPGTNADVYLQFKTKDGAESAYDTAAEVVGTEDYAVVVDEFGRKVHFCGESLRYVALVDVRQDAVGNCETQLVQAEVRSSAERRAQANPLLRSLGQQAPGGFNG